MQALASASMPTEGLLDPAAGTGLFVVVTIAGLLAAAWVYRDASRRGISNPGIWAVAIGFLFLLYALPGLAALVVYVMIRSTLSDPDRDGTTSPEPPFRSP